MQLLRSVYNSRELQLHCLAVSNVRGGAQAPAAACTPGHARPLLLLLLSLPATVSGVGILAIAVTGIGHSL